MPTCRVWPAQELALMLLGEPSTRPECQSRSVASEAPFALGCLAKAVNLGRTTREAILQVGRTFGACASWEQVEYQKYSSAK